ncbi:uncharacterized protein LOC129762170 isoform X2 [Toxorhynchites rutilus septentrionalis]|nr:uncharacterized protein LOC129762170 isoform X2 [Toxorhynchites rutilus septentrionalis]XP_055616158.1 uncharacterized protein LOC129762170 isoform X2 [Toxorhynchites rutilus septentrionalis]XP_055616159.1 uncharacterized protein LOC129762170 isoform X2 [Toxorhynchites rutilus septentrionalis]XP_055616160.1 uncharacterized protein LOC129762170 isoform X2 [Toxorhynchites rutilus septentrionalis]XP_055616161.1 uncharacterized protein LOC129762170 isoform X2 [Toxorhynchites rutilus septentriona
MDKLELDIRKEIEELNTDVSLIDRLDSNDPAEYEHQVEQSQQLRSGVFDNVNSSHAKNSLTDSQISIISKHDGYPDSGHFYSTPQTPKPDGGHNRGDSNDKIGDAITTATDKDRTQMYNTELAKPVTSSSGSDAISKDTKADCGVNSAEAQKSGSNSNDTKKDHKYAASKQQKKSPAIDQQYSPNGANSSLVSFLFPPGAHHQQRQKKQKLPSIVVLGVIQLMFSVTLAALGGLVLARNASLAMAGTGLWCGAIAGIAGSLGFINLKTARTGFLAMNLICVASSTLGLALTGIGAVRDANLAQQDESSWNAVTAGSGLLCALAIHFLVSVFSVYYSALKLCSRRPTQKTRMMENVIHSGAPGSQSFMSQQKVEDYINSIQMDPSLKDMMYQTMLRRSYGSLYGDKHRTDNFSNGTGATPRPVMLVPACTANGRSPMMPIYPTSPPPPPPGVPPVMYPPNIMPPGGMPHYPPMYPESAMLEAQIARANRRRSVRAVDHNAPIEDHYHQQQQQRHLHHHQQQPQHQEQTFTYTGLDRDIADSYLAKEEEKLNSTSTTGSSGPATLIDAENINQVQMLQPPPVTYHHDLMLIDHRHNFERYNDVHM